MSKLPSVKRLALEDYPSQKSWISALLYPINLFFTGVVQALSNGLTFTDNFSAQVKTVYVAKPPTTGSYYPYTLAWPFKQKPIGLWIVSAYEVTPPHTNFTVAVGADWAFTTDGKVQINAFPGLPTTTDFNVTVVMITG